MCSWLVRQISSHAKTGIGEVVMVDDDIGIAQCSFSGALWLAITSRSEFGGHFSRQKARRLAASRL